MEFDVVIIVVDLVSKKAYFVPTHITVTMESIIRLFLYHVWKLYGLSTQVVSDHELQFIVLFIKKLYKLLGVKIISSTA